MPPPPVHASALVSVIGPDRQFRYYVNRGGARRLLRDRSACIFAHDPLTLKLINGEGAPLCDRFFFRQYDASVRVLDTTGAFATVFLAAKATNFIREGRAHLVTYSPPTIRLVRVGSRSVNERRPVMEHASYLNANGDIVNWTEFFRQERDIYVQNLSDTQISLTIRLRNGDFEYVLLERTPDPINLTSRISFEDLKGSLDIRKNLNVRNSKNGRRLLRVLEEEEYHTYFAQKAKMLQVSSEEAIRRADDARRALRQSAEPIQRVMDEAVSPAPTMAPVLTEDDLIRDRIRILMYGVNQDVLDEQGRAKGEGRAFDSGKVKPASQILAAVQMEHDLTADELEHIRAKGYWPSVKRWASIQLEKLVQTPSVDEAPVARDDGDEFIRRQAMTE